MKQDEGEFEEDLEDSPARSEKDQKRTPKSVIGRVSLQQRDESSYDRRNRSRSPLSPLLSTIQSFLTTSEKNKENAVATTKTRLRLLDVTIPQGLQKVLGSTFEGSCGR